MKSIIIKILILSSILQTITTASTVYITIGNFDKNSKLNKVFCKKSNLQELNSVLLKNNCQNTGLISKKSWKMEWYKCAKDTKKIDLLATYTSTSFDCKTRANHAISKQREYKSKAIPTKKRYFVSRGSLYEDKAKSYCKEIEKNQIRALTYKNDCADYTSKIRKYSENIDYYKCERGEDIYITRDGKYGDTSKITSVDECKKVNTKVANLKNPNAPKEFITVGSLDMSKSRNLQTYCLQNNREESSLQFLEKQLKTKCNEIVFSSNIQYTNDAIKKYKCGSIIVHITTAGTKDKCVVLNRKANKKIVQLEKEYKEKQERIAKEYKEKQERIAKEKARQEKIAREKVEQKQIAREEAKRKRKRVAKDLALAKSNGFDSYEAYKKYLIKKAKEKKDLELKAKRKKAEDNLKLAKSKGFNSVIEYNNFLYAKRKGYSSYNDYLHAENLFTAVIGCNNGYDIPWVQCIDEIKLNGRISNQPSLMQKFSPSARTIKLKLTEHFNLTVKPSQAVIYYVKIINNITGKEVFYDEKNNEYSRIKIKN